MKLGFIAMHHSLSITAKHTTNLWVVTTASSTTTNLVVVMSSNVPANRRVICPECKKEIEVRSGFAHFTLTRHMKEHAK
jgi:hypothetical protein